MDQEMKSQLIEAAERWEDAARSKFHNARHWREKGDMFGARFIEHGAFCYFNCANELRRLLDAEVPHGPASGLG